MFSKNPKEKKFTKFHKSWKKERFVEELKNTKKGFLQIKSKQQGKISINELNSILLTIKKSGGENYKFNVLSTFYSTKKPIETRMGKGKGPINQQIAWIRKGQTLLSFSKIKNLQKYNHLTKKIMQRINLKTVPNKKLIYW
jgi:ribosomal protein L16/L10AE